LPWADIHYPAIMEKLIKEFPSDIIVSPEYLSQSPRTSGDPYKIGTFIDEWGCTFTQKENGFIGEVKRPISVEEDFSDFGDKVHIPNEWLTVDIDQVNAFCKSTSKFVKAGACPRPFEQLQFIRGAEQFYVDLMMQEDGFFQVLDEVHNFYKKQLTLWAQSDVDALMIMDDWGSQNSLLINPVLWRTVFKPLYQDYVSIAKNYNKKMFMHSDGYILDIYPDIIEMGIDALNSQLFCMGLENLKQYSGKITFWGEIDRQYLLPFGTLDEVEKAVNDVYANLYQDGGCIAQCSFGPGGKGENVVKVFESWNNLI